MYLDLLTGTAWLSDNQRVRHCFRVLKPQILIVLGWSVMGCAALHLRCEIMFSLRPICSSSAYDRTLPTFMKVPSPSLCRKWRNLDRPNSLLKYCGLLSTHYRLGISATIASGGLLIMRFVRLLRTASTLSALDTSTTESLVPLPFSSNE